MSGAIHVLHHAFFGAIAAVGFGVLFNFGLETLLYCFASGALALAIRTLGLSAGWTLEGASFAAAGAATLLSAGLLRRPLGTLANAVAVAGCIPLVPGAFFAQALMGLFALTASEPAHAEAATIATIGSMLRVVFTLVGIGAGIAIPVHILRRREF
jgi:uncharacterized membrane protein YjjB (DUF3815 family)